MRIPIPTVITLAIAVTLASWFIGTRKMDFAKAPTPEQFVQIAKQWEDSKPHITPLKKSKRQLAETSADNSHQVLNHDTRKKPDQFPEIDFDSAPLLSEHGVLQDKGAGYLSRFASHLESIGQSKHALLAWERVIDTTYPDKNERKQALSAIKRLKGSQPPWNPDPSSGIQLTLQAGASVNDAQALKRALEIAAQNMSTASGGVVQVSVKLSLGKSPNNQAAVVPIALWLSRPASATGTTQAETSPVSFMADPNNESILINEIQMGAYNVIGKQLAKETSFSQLAEQPEKANEDTANPETSNQEHAIADELIECYITRLMWREFANSMKE